MKKKFDIDFVSLFMEFIVPLLMISIVLVCLIIGIKDAHNRFARIIPLTDLTSSEYDNEFINKSFREKDIGSLNRMEC